MKVFIVLAVIVATASAALVASPGIGLNSYGLGLGAPLVSSGLVSPISYGGQYARTLQPIVSPIGGVRTISPYGAYGLRSAPIYSNVLAPSVYSGYGNAIYASG